MKDYKQLATDLRKIVLGITYKAQSSHIGSNFSCADLLTILYDIVDLTTIKNGITKDIVVVKSWAAADVYACLVAKGLLNKDAIDHYGEEGTPWTTILEPIPPFIPFGTGAMGYHLPAAVGFALAKKLKNEDGTVYCLISDGECQIGSTWESALIAAHYQLDNLTLIIDRNGLQAMGKVDDILPVRRLRDIFKNIGWSWGEIDGHDYRAIEGILKRKYDRPKVVIANTIKGKGISFMENNNLWHYSHVSSEVLESSLKELNQ